MIHARFAALVLLGAGTICGCAYFNGLYNANRLVKDANRAEREGRVGEARSLWSQAAVKAESVAVRYPTSKYHDDALLLQGRALRAAGQCGSAFEPLRAAIETSPDTTVVEMAHYFLGRCQLVFGRVDSAIVSFSRALPSDDTLLASVAHLWRGRALSELGEYRQAVVDFSASSLVDAAFDLAIAYARLGQRAGADRVLRWRVDGDYTESLWLSALDSIGEHLPDLAATIVELLLERPGLSRAQKGNLLLRDGDRWADRGDIARAISRYDRVVDVSPGSVSGAAARFRLLVVEVQAATDFELLPEWLESLQMMPDAAGPMFPALAEISTALEMAMLSLQDHVAADLPAEDWRLQNPDLEMFLAAEALRDLADANPLAAALFEEVVTRYPESPVAPKALLAAAALKPDSADRLIATLQRKYPLSPYTLVLTGAAKEAYAALEDSIRTLILARRGAT